MYNLFNTCIPMSPDNIPLWSPNNDVLIVGDDRGLLECLVFAVEINTRTYYIIDSDLLAIEWLNRYDFRSDSL